ncbi:C1 family peptidase [Spirosoma gilvum]
MELKTVPLKWENDRKCTFGIDAGSALDYIKQYGLPPFSAFPDPNSCERHRHASTRIDSSSRIEDYAKLFNITDPKDAKVLAAKQALAEGAPIVVGIETTGSMANLSFEKTLVPRLKSFVSELLDKEVSSEPMMAWEPYQANSLEFGHAMCVVGYDDKMLGKGAFKLINSWGSSWGDKGYFWMSYDTFGKFAKYGYQAFLPPATATSGNLLDTDLKIMTDVFTDKGVPFTTISTNNGLMTYALTEPQRTGTSFKFKIDVKKQTYLYLITASESDSAVTKLLPLPGYKMVVAPGNRLIYPSADLNLKLSGISGQEYWLFLLSATPLDIDHYIQLLNRRLSRFTVIQDDSSAEQYVQKPISLKSPFPDRVANVFRKDLVPTELIRYKRKKMGFFVQNDPKAHGRVVPLLVTMSHVP